MTMAKTKAITREVAVPSKRLIVWLEEVRNTDIPIVGGKGASLGEMLSAELPVPRGFVVTAQAFREFLESTGIAEKLFEGLKVDVDDARALDRAAAEAKKLILETPMPENIEKAIREYYAALCKREGEEVYVAARSSATAEDLPEASFAGQQETFLNVRGADDLVKAVHDCWASLYGARAIYYRVKQNFPHEHVNIAVVVQVMVDAEEAGVMFTSHPTTGEDVTIIEAAWGLGESVVSGAVSPDTYMVNNKDFSIMQKKVATKQTMIVRDRKTRKSKQVEVPEDKKNAQVLPDDIILRLAKLGQIVAEHYGKPQDIEWAVKGGELYLLQSRPITTIQKREAKGGLAAGEVILEGLGASPGVASGKVKIVQSMGELDKVLDGDILVTKMTTPDMVPAMKRSAAIITDEGGMTCHAAIVSRELGTPAVVGTRDATRVLQDGQVVTVDGEKGHVLLGSLKKPEEKGREEAKAIAPPVTKPITATEVKVNVSIPEAAERAKATLADGVGLLRIEHMILGLNTHPKVYIESGRSDEYVAELVKGIRTVADAFYPKPVWVRTLDAPTDEFRAMKGGEGEPYEHNPMLGMRGIRRDLRETEHFRLEMAAFKKLFEMGYDNIGIMLPLVQHPREVRRAKEIMAECGIDLEKVDVGIMVEIPASAIIIDDFIKEGIDFVSFGTNDLTQYTLAVDRNNELVADLYDELHPAVLKLIEHVIERCSKAGVKTSICGQAGSRPEVARRLVAMGITSISANIDAVEAVREMVARTEHEIILEAARKKVV
jgi:pyruvate,water dikinase